LVRTLGFGYEPRAPFAVDPAASRGRRYPEAESPTRTGFQRDRDRIIHSTAFRRLKHKTQVFVFHEGDHFRTRLTHSIEVSQIARSIARALRLDEDLAEALALAHDLGHTPFGHTGETALDACLSEWGGFDHNAQTLRIVTRLERHYAAFDGLNLTWETLEGLVKHNGPLTDREGNPLPRWAESGLPLAVRAYEAHAGLMLWSYPSLEAQAAAIADDIAYNAHDIDDGLRAGMFDLADLDGLALASDFLAVIERRYPGLERARVIHELTRRMITAMVEDVIVTAAERIEALAPASADAVRAAGRLVIGFSPAMAAADQAIKDFLFAGLYRHSRMVRVRADAEQVLRDLFGRYLADPAALPEEWRAVEAPLERAQLARKIGDYIAGMTDRFALAEHRRLFDATPELR